MNGLPVSERTATTPLVTDASLFTIGGSGVGSNSMVFNGLVDEARLFTYNPLATGSGAFEPSRFLISAVPEPGAAVWLTGAVLLAW